ncbi:MAG: FkbM family methyltransferase, partial [Planctomycetota bacterium]|nr:FkbM family methyltransferase [Planctomycetota bacterium]
MKIFHGLKKRFSGQYRIRERVLAPKAAACVREKLPDLRQSHPREARYLEQWLPYLDKIGKYAGLSMFTGKKTALRLAGLKKSDLSPTAEALYGWLKDLYANNGHFEFNNIKIPFAHNPNDYGLFFYLFNELILEQLLPGHPDITNFFSREGSYENPPHVAFSAGDTVLDCGANIGCFSALAASKGCKVYAFEPVKHIRENYLQQTADLNGNIALCPYALSDAAGSMEFMIVPNNLGGSREATSDARANYGRETVQAIPLDDYLAENNIGDVHAIKADIEGAERKMLRGAAKTLAKYAP